MSCGCCCTCVDPADGDGEDDGEELEDADAAEGAHGDLDSAEVLAEEDDEQDLDGPDLLRGH